MDVQEKEEIVANVLGEESPKKELQKDENLEKKDIKTKANKGKIQIIANIIEDNTDEEKIDMPKDESQDEIKDEPKDEPQDSVIQDEAQSNETQKNKIKIPLWGAILLLLLLCGSITFIAYKIILVKTTKEVINLPVHISSNFTVIDIGQKMELQIDNFKEGTVLVSDNPEIIQVEGNYIIGIAEGETTIYAITGDEKSNILNFKCTITLKDIELSESNIELTIGEEKEISVAPIPDNATNREFIWTSSNEEIATVENGKIHALAEGTAIITVYNAENNIEKNCTVIVKEIEVNNISLDETSVNLGVGQAYILLATISPSNATNKNLTWLSSNNNVVSVDNGQIKATGIGKATITVSSKNGVRGTCTFNVSKTAPDSKLRYVSEDFNVRIGPGTEYTKLGSVTINDEIEILQETNNWAKIRIKKSGIVGYTISKAYSTSKRYYVNNVPFINQLEIGLPTGCEAVSATMAARYAGYNISVQTIINNTPTDSLGKRQETRKKEVQKEVKDEETGETKTITTTDEETVWVGENPFKYFVGYPTKKSSEGSYGCFAAPITTALTKSGIPCTNISGCSVDTLYSYIQKGKPVIVWGRVRAQDLTQGVTWQYPDGSGEYVELVGEHCFVLIGYNADNVYLNDPIAGKGVSQPRWKFESNWYKLYSQAIIIN